MFLVVTGVPAAIAWLQGHEMACSWSPGWQRFAGWFGDCGAYAQKPTQVVVTGPLAPQTKGDVYRFNLKRFLESIDQDDKEELDKLAAEGWRLQTSDACNLLLGRQVTPALVSTVEKFSKDRISCGGSDGPVHLLSRGPKCWRDFSTFATEMAAIDEWMKIRPSQELKVAASRLLKAYRFAESASQSQLIKLCNDRHSTSRVSGAVNTLGSSETDFADAVFSFSGSCQAMGHSYDSRSIVSLIGISDLYGGHAQPSVLGMCENNVKKLGIDPKAVPIKEYLQRWAK